MLFRGLLNCGRTMVYTVLLLMMVLYIFSCIGIEVVAHHRLAEGADMDPIFRSIVDEHFYSLPATMLTLFRFVTMDNLHQVYTPLIEQDWTLALFFLTVILVISIA